jgi:hypothetical protein
MQNESSHIIATCAQCSFRFDILFGIDCPRCRTEAVKEAFKPVDALRTALGIKGLYEDAELDGVFHWYQWGESNYQEEYPQVRMPKYEDDQIWELRRLFRL